MSSVDQLEIITDLFGNMLFLVNPTQGPILLPERERERERERFLMTWSLLFFVEVWALYSGQREHTTHFSTLYSVCPLLFSSSIWHWWIRQNGWQYQHVQAQCTLLTFGTELPSSMLRVKIHPYFIEDLHHVCSGWKFTGHFIISRLSQHTLPTCFT